MYPAPTEAQKISSLVSCLSGKALEWATAVWNFEQPTQGSYAEFTRRFRVVFDHPHEGREAGERLFHLRQETRSAQEFALEFRTLAAGSGWNERAQIDHYRCSLREDVRRELACRDVSLSFDQLADMSIRLDNLLAARGRPGRGPPVPPCQPDAAVPMDLGAAAAVGQVSGRTGAECLQEETRPYDRTTPHLPPRVERRQAGHFRVTPGSTCPFTTHFLPLDVHCPSYVPRLSVAFPV